MERVLGVRLNRPHLRCKDKSKKSETSKTSELRIERVEVQWPKIYICDPSAVVSLEAAHESSPLGRWIKNRLQKEGLYMCSSNLFKNKQNNLKLAWKVWQPTEGTDMASPTLIDMVLRMIGVTEDVLEDHSLYDSVVTLLQAHSAHASPRGMRRLVTNNVRFWELFFSTEEKREKTRWAIQTAGGGRQLIEVERVSGLPWRGYRNKDLKLLWDRVDERQVTEPLMDGAGLELGGIARRTEILVDKGCSEEGIKHVQSEGARTWEDHDQSLMSNNPRGQPRKTISLMEENSLTVAQGEPKFDGRGSRRGNETQFEGPSIQGDLEVTVKQGEPKQAQSDAFHADSKQVTS